MISPVPGLMRLPSSDSPASQASVSVNAALSELRRELAMQWLKLPASELGSFYQRSGSSVQRFLRTGALRNPPMDDRDRELMAGVIQGLREADPAQPDIGRLLAAMLYLEPHELPYVIDFSRIPPWLLDDYGTYMMTAPDLFRYPGEAELFARHMQRWIDYLHAGILGNPRNELWLKIGNFVIQTLNLVSIYFNELNVREFYRKRAQIYEFVLSTGGNRIDWAFLPGPVRPRIRLGILAAHFSPQTETFATLPVYEHLDRRVFEIVLFSRQVTNSPLERHCISRADHFVPLPAGLPNQVQTIRQADLDMLLIGTNVTAVTNEITLLGVHRLARVQVTLVPSCTTSGMRHMDYYLSGRLSEPAEKAQEHYTESLLLVDGPAHCYDFATEQIPAPTENLTRESLGIPPDAVTFISGANFYKLIPEVQNLWMQIMAATPGSRLILYPFNPNWSNSYPVEKFLERFQAAAATHGIAADRLVVLAPAPNRGDVLARLRLADVYLDSFPFSGATSLLDPLVAGLPALVMDGSTFRALVGPALLRSMGLEELVAPDAGEYLRIATHLASDTASRSRVQEHIRKEMQAVPKFLDPRWYGAEVEKILTALWKSRSGR